MKNNKQNTEWVGYATPNKEARKMLPKDIRNDHRFYPTKKSNSDWKYIKI